MPNAAVGIGVYKRRNEAAFAVKSVGVSYAFNWVWTRRPNHSNVSQSSNRLSSRLTYYAARSVQLFVSGRQKLSLTSFQARHMWL